MSQLNCLRCKQPIDAEYDQCPHCGERITLFQRTYATRLLDGKYQIIDRLGVGGMGEIFKVRHIHLNELRVIKIMRPNVASDDQGLQRFLQEARTSTMIKHKNLAMLYDFAQLEDGSYYMVWEFIDGTNIQKWIAQQGAMPSRLTIEIAIQALHGLDHLHSMGLIHRDISPENIMLSQDHHGKLLVKVIDFGIAKQLAEGEGGQGLTQTGMFLGKLKYASPEQAGFLQEGEHIDPRSDLYSFGIVMYEMLAGKAPFQATNPHGYILKHVTEKPAPIAEMNPDSHVPPQLESIIMQSLEKTRDTRFATAADFAKALETIRSSVAPDPKFGLGEKMITLSGAQTLADLPKITSTGPGATMAGVPAPTYAGAPPPRVGPTGTRAGKDDATVMERDLVTAPRKIGSNEATVMEPLGETAGAPTTMERRTKLGEAELPGDATVLERLAPAPARNKRTAILATAAAVVLLMLALGGYFVFRKPEPAPVAALPTTAGVDLTATGNAPASSAKGTLLLSASPWGDLDSIISKEDQKEVQLSEDLSTPARILLDPGEYTVTLRGPTGPRSIDVRITAGEENPQNVAMTKLDFDAIVKEVRKP
jgi:eukaryotic-like serine/threonine-protein kinase